MSFLFIFIKKLKFITMKYLYIIAAFLFTISTYAQKKPSFVKEGNLVVGTYYHDDGTVSQTGAYLDGKLHGKWISYNRDGEKVTEGNYTNGVKSGTWFFWDGKELSEVKYNNNQITTVISHNSSSNVVMNFRNN